MITLNNTEGSLRNFGGRKYRTYKGEVLGDVTISYKIDGVRAIYSNGKVTSRARKPLYNLPKMPDGHYEVYTGGFKDTIQKTRTHDLETIPTDCLYSLSPIDPRLIVGSYIYVDDSLIADLMLQAITLGYEGLVIFSDKYMYLDIHATNVCVKTNKKRGLSAPSILQLR